MNWTLETIGTLAGLLAIYGTVLNARRRRSCFAIWLASNALSAFIHVALVAWAMALRDAIFFGLAIYGLQAWKRPQTAFFRVYSPAGTRMLLTPHAAVAAAYFASGGMVELI